MNDRKREWAWDVVGSFNPRHDATAGSDGLSYGVEIQGPFCGWDPAGSQSWEGLLSAGPPSAMAMPPSIAAEVRAYALAMLGESGRAHLR